jgi:ABC-type multidrug transport system ATPase subunit
MKFEICNITKKYGKNVVLNNFSYSFESGLYLLTGVNGIGKSTLLKIIAKVIYPSNLNFRIERLKVAYLCEKTELSNIGVYSFLQSISKLSRVKINIKELIKKWKIPRRNIMNLSKGNKQKVAILMMILTYADLYLFDEPTDALDTDAKKLFIEYINELLLQGKIVIISTHDKECFKEMKYEELKLECLD